MALNEQATNSYGDYFIGSSLSVPDVSSGCIVEGQYWFGGRMEGVSGSSDVNMRAIHDGTFADASVDVRFDVTSSMTGSLIDLLQTKCFGSLSSLTGHECSTQDGSNGNEMQSASMLCSWAPAEQIVSSGTCMDMQVQQSEHQSHAFPLPAVDKNHDLDFQPNLKGKTITCTSPAPPLRTMSKNSREKSKEAEYNRRSIMNERLQALRELLPASLKGNNRESIVDNAIGHIKHLQLELKELSASRLGGEPISAPLICMEGHGHYYPHDRMLEKSVEEVIGSLIEENPTAAWQLLESKGLYMIPIASVEALREAELISTG